MLDRLMNSNDFIMVLIGLSFAGDSFFRSKSKFWGCVWLCFVGYASIQTYIKLF